MKLAINYGNAVAVLPQSAFEKIDKATKKDLKLLFALASDNSLLGLEDNILSILADITKMKSEEVKSSLAFWRGAGIIEYIEDNSDFSDEKLTSFEDENKKSDAPKKLKSADELPRYSTEELTSLLEKRAECRILIDECQQLFGKIFTSAEINLLVALVDYLGLDSEYILLLFAHCGKMEHKSVRTVEKLAHKFLDEGINEAHDLSERLHFLEQTEQLEAQVRRVFGISSRALTKKEKALIEKWLRDYGYGFEIIERAYELTIDSTQSPSLPYAGAIMDRWFSEGFKTLADIEKDISEHKKAKTPTGGSLDTDEFLQASLKRSFGNK